MELRGATPWGKLPVRGVTGADRWFDARDGGWSMIGLGTHGRPDLARAKLLKWHEKLVKKSGLGCIVRALTDRKTVMKLASGQAGAAAYGDATR